MPYVNVERTPIDQWFRGTKQTVVVKKLGLIFRWSIIIFFFQRYNEILWANRKPINSRRKQLLTSMPDRFCWRSGRALWMLSQTFLRVVWTTSGKFERKSWSEANLKIPRATLQCETDISSNFWQLINFASQNTFHLNQHCNTSVTISAMKSNIAKKSVPNMRHNLRLQYLKVHLQEPLWR